MYCVHRTSAFKKEQDEDAKLSAHSALIIIKNGCIRHDLNAPLFQATAAATDDSAQQQATLNFGQSVADAYVSLLDNVLAISQQPANNELKKNLVPHSKNVATAVSNLVRAGESMKGG